MNNPVLVETIRGDLVDLRNRGAVAVSDADGRLDRSVGDVDRPIYPRSATKLFQALPLVESGAADRYEFTDEQLALACASHSGEDAHVATAAAMLEKAGLSERDLECGVHWPDVDQDKFIEFARRGTAPNQLHNNCSGKHAGFLCVACHQGIATAGYVGAEHEVQRQITAAQEEMMGHRVAGGPYAIDGCAIPTYGFPLRALALGLARVATGEGLAPGRKAAVKRLMDACIAHPWLTGGTGKVSTRLIEAGEGEIYAKNGANGVYVAALPRLGLGVALKCDDGSGEAAEIMMADVLLRLLGDDGAIRARLEPLARRVVTSRKGVEVGEVRPASS